MTTEQKAKAYDEALKRAKAAIDIAADKDLVKGVATTIFPELRESEDERIRKWLVALVENLGDPADEEAEKELEVMRPLALSYLEKQKELLGFGRGFYYYDGEKTTYIGCPATEENPYDFAMSQQEKQKEQKPAEKQDYSGLTDLERAIHRGFLVAGVENVPVTIIKETAQECLEQMKPAEWSEDDEQYLLVCKNALSKYQRSDQWDANIISNWLERRLKLYKPAEWSEENKNMLLSIINAFRNGTVSTIEQEQWLKTLPKRFNSQPHWKPSE